MYSQITRYYIFFLQNFGSCQFVKYEYDIIYKRINRATQFSCQMQQQHTLAWDSTSTCMIALDSPKLKDYDLFIRWK